MRNYILLNQSSVVEGVVSRSSPMPDPWVEMSEANETWVGRKFTNGAIESETTSTSLMTQVSWLKRLGRQAHVQIEELMTNDANLRVGARMLLAANEVDVSDPDTIDFVDYLLSIEIIDLAKKDALLALKPLNERGAIHPITGVVTS